MIFYINLEHRPDRREHIEKEIGLFCTEPAKVVRIDAVKHEVGAIGCTKSHIQAIEQFLANSSWKTCMILEDDFTCRARTAEEIHTRLRLFFSSFSEWDMLSLSYNPQAFTTTPTHVGEVVKVLSTQTSSGYCLHRRFAPLLLANLKEGCMLKEMYTHLSNYCLDIYWKQIQPIANWYALVPAVGYQYENYSDVEKRVANYGC